MGPKHELRVSFPVCNHSPAYTCSIQKLADSRTSVADVRKDSYFITPCHFGLKHRNGEALELKIRDRETESGLEFWTKTALTNEDVSACAEEIVSLLAQKGYEAAADELAIGETVTLAKTVSKIELDKVNYEVTCICVEHGDAVHKDWVSVVIEGKKAKNVLKFLSTAKEAEDFRRVIRVVEELSGVVPLVAGYPMFVRHAVGKALPEDHEEVKGAWNRLVESLRAVNPEV